MTENNPLLPKDAQHHSIGRKLRKGFGILTLMLILAMIIYGGYYYYATGGRSIAFTSARTGNLEIFVMNSIGILKNITNNPADDSTPAWSPDGTKIAFMTDRDGNAEIYVMNADGSNPTNITNNPARDIDPSWSPDGSLIAFSSDRGEESTTKIYLANVNSQDVEQLTFDNYYNHYAPSWSPDGKMLLIYRWQFMKLPEICKVRVKTSTTMCMHLTGEDPSWSPDGTEIVYQDPSLNLIYAATTYGDNAREISTYGCGDPEWSPDGKRLAYYKFTSDRGSNIFIQIVEGIDLQLTFSSSLNQFPSWQP